MKYEVEPCTFCDGTGVDPAEDPDGGECVCPECGGAGEVEIEDEESP